MPSISKSLQLVQNMGLRYIIFRLGYEFEKKLGNFKKKYPQQPPMHNFISLASWRKESRFFGVKHNDSTINQTSLSPEIDKLLKGQFPFFSAQCLDLGTDYDWITNPDTGHRYDAAQHWSEVQDYSHSAGDIKYVWEKSRFSYLYEVIRNDHLKKEDHSQWVFNEIKSWLTVNKINSGPNYKCSQEISLRVLNWTYALNYYKDSIHLTEGLFNEIMHAIYWQIKHVYANINFSRIAVRNNHALTETLTLFLCGLYFPFFPEATQWKADGKKWFEEEVAYQVYPDGTFLQFSMNYHRVVIQLFCWAFKSVDFFGEKFDELVYERAYKSLVFLYSCQNVETGWLPNYGNNDGALFFKLNSCDFRDYRPQLNALHVLLTGANLYGEGDWREDAYWFVAGKIKDATFTPLKHEAGWSSFINGGYYILREKDTLTFIRCGSHKDRPAQADNLHIDIWHNGKNVLFDGGTYKYNTDPEKLKYFMGTASHNTVMLKDFDQMEKGSRFIWFNWTQAINASTLDHDDEFIFEGEISAFRQIDPKIRHYRKIRKSKKAPDWVVEDFIMHKPAQLEMLQYWHVRGGVNISSEDQHGNSLLLRNEKGFRSDYYGMMEEADQFLAGTKTDKISTRISIE